MTDEICTHPRTGWTKSADGKNAIRHCLDCDVGGIQLALDLIEQGRTDGGFVIGARSPEAPGSE